MENIFSFFIFFFPFYLVFLLPTVLSFILFYSILYLNTWSANVVHARQAANVGSRCSGA